MCCGIIKMYLPQKQFYYLSFLRVATSGCRFLFHKVRRQTAARIKLVHYPVIACLALLSEYLSSFISHVFVHCLVQCCLILYKKLFLEELNHNNLKIFIRREKFI